MTDYDGDQRCVNYYYIVNSVLAVVRRSTATRTRYRKYERAELREGKNSFKKSEKIKKRWLIV